MHQNYYHRKKNSQAIEENKQDTTSNKIFKLKELLPYLYIMVLSMFITYDYYVYTETFNFHQSTFFNFVLPSIINESFLIIFIVIPFLVVLFIVFLIKVEYDFFKKFQFEEYYFKIEKKGLLKYILQFLLFVVILSLGLLDIFLFIGLNFLFNFLDSSSLLAFFLLVYLGYIGINYITLKFAFNLTFYANKEKENGNKIIKFLLKCIPKFIKKDMNIQTTFSFFISVILGAKIILIPSIALIESLSYIKHYNILATINISIVFILAFVLMYNHENKSYVSSKNKLLISKKPKFNDLIKMLTLIYIPWVIIFSLLDYPKDFLSIRFGDNSFWNSLVYENNLAKTNFALISNPLKINRIYDNGEIKKILSDQVLKDNICKEFDIDLTVFENENDIEIFTIKNERYQILFIKDVLYEKILTINYSKDEEILDVGYIEVN